MKRRLRIILEYILGFTIIILLLFAIAGVVVVKFHGEDLKEYVLEQVNNRLDTKVSVEEATVRVFHKFPSTSIVLDRVTVWSSHNFDTRGFDGQGADTLLMAETVSISFNLFGMVMKKYNIRELEIRNGFLRLYTDQHGEGNYMLTGGQGNERDGDNLVDIAHFQAHNFRVWQNNQAKQLESNGTLERLSLNGRFSRQNTQVKGSLKGTLGKVSNKGILYASDRQVEGRINLDVRDSVFTIRAGHLQIDRVMADMDGQFFLHRGHGVELNLVAAARDLEIHEVLDLLPAEVTNSLKEIRGNGILQLYARITGMASSTRTPLIEADFETSNANLFWERLPFSLKNLNLAGTYSNGGGFSPVTTTLVMESISAVIGHDHLSASGEIINFYDPKFSLELKGDIHPEQWLLWYPSIPLHGAGGTIFSDIRVTGAYDRQKPRGSKFITFDISGGISLEEAWVLLQEDGIPFKDLSGKVSIDNDFWEPAFSGTFGESDFTIRGTGLNLLSLLVGKKETLVASATFRSDYLNLQQVLDQLPGKRSGKKSAVNFPGNLDLRLDFSINDLVKDRLTASGVRGVALYDAPFFYIDSLTMQAMEGTIRGSFGMVQDTEKDIYSTVDVSLYNLDIQQLFYAFNNFGQKQLTHEHLKGTISGTSVFSADFDSTFSIRYPSILNENNITIRDGELNGFTPIMALSRFIEVDELQNIRFKTLENNILIRESQVIIPVMDIQSNALNLSASGTHGFDNKYDYRLQLKLSELLYSKARGARRGEFEMAEDESDTRILFLKVYSDGTGAKVEMDRRKAVDKIRDDLKSEKSELKSILNEELGLFRHDEEIDTTRQQREKQGEVFRFEFPDEQDTEPPGSGKRGKRRIFQRSKKDTAENKPANKFVIDE